MAHPNEDVVRSYIASLGAGDMDGVRKHLADEIVMHMGGRNPMSGDKRGPDEVVGTFEAITERTGAPISTELHDLLSTEDHVVALGRRTIAGVDAPAAVVYHLADGKITEIWVHEARQYELDEALGS